MELPAYFTFLMVSALQIATPGPSTLFIVNNAIAHGWRRALAALSGDLLAIALLATLSVVGLGALLLAYPVAFLALRLAGEYGATPPTGLVAVCAVSPTMDLARCVEALERRSNRIYEWNFVRNLKARMRRKAAASVPRWK